jgi:hypothetical protein
MQGSAQIWTAKVKLTFVSGFAGNSTPQREVLHLSLLESLQHGSHVELRMNGIAGEGVVKLEAELLARWDRRTHPTQRDARRGVALQGFAGARIVFRSGEFVAHGNLPGRIYAGSSAVGCPIDLSRW